MKKIYWKAISSAFLIATANYWFGELCNATSLNSTSEGKAISETVINIALFLPNTFLFLPILAGIIIDYIGVIPIIQSLSVTYFIGAAFFVAAALSTINWLFVLCAFFFGFSLHMTYMATYIYLCNTFITKSKDIKYFKQVLGIYLSLGYTLICISLLIGPEYKIAKLSFGGFLLIIGVILSFFLKVRIVRNSSVYPNNAADTTKISIERGQSLLYKGNAYEATFIEYNEKVDQEEVNARGFSVFFKELGWKNITKLTVLGLVIGISCNLNETKNLHQSIKKVPPYIFALHYVSYALFGLIFSFIKWNKNRIEKVIIAATFLYALCITISGISLPLALRIVLCAFQNMSTGVMFYTIQLYIPFVIQFKIDCMGKAIGLFWWFVSLQMFLGTWINGNVMSLDLVSYDVVFVMPAVLVVIVFSLLVYSENRKVNRPTSSNIISL